MGREKGLWWCCWCLVLWPSLLLTAGVVSSELYNKTCTSQCGFITNISFPFRLPHDPPHCGDPDYELACENNVTLLHLHLYDDVFEKSWEVGTYRVVGINYDNLRIKLVDPGIQAGNCSSLPLYSLSLYDFNYFESHYDNYENNGGTESSLFKQVAYLNCSDLVRDDTAYVDTAPCVKGGGHLYAVAGDLLAPRFQPQCRLEFVTPVASDWGSLVPDGIKSYADIHTLIYVYNTRTEVLKQVAYLNCSDPVRDDTAYVDTAPCVKGGGHLYAVAGDLLAPRFQPQCRLEYVTLVASDWESLVPHGIKSYADIHTLLSFGFELSWWKRACDDYNCPNDTTCYIVVTTKRIFEDD
ncbi:hypothetical protein K1719_044292 [Acacia pycnantha]|nr:hypothetical protein K1719_044292 [Acacia pycnantha]